MLQAAPRGLPGGVDVAKFMLLLHDRPKAFAGLSPAEMQQIVLKYVAWGRRLRARKLMVEGGYYIVKAKDYDEALHLALDCPHVAYGAIEVRQVDEV
jgi:hypothetical protein